jgi:cellulose synthase/poly-beta-1,6-N-acetylglucosamine synthase-like glycosyltransferase
MRKTLKLIWLEIFLTILAVTFWKRSEIFSISEINWLKTDLKNIIAYLVFAINILFTIILSFNFIISLFGFWVKKLPRDRNKNLMIPITDKYNNFILLICAHNEENVIKNSLEEMIRTTYPNEHLVMIVICDNCTDQTYNEAQKVRLANPYKNLIILERKDETLKGKPHAIKYALEWIDRYLPKYDALSIADADNIYVKEYFDIMNYYINCGEEIVQGYLGVKNPYDSYVSASGMYGYSAGARGYFACRQNLGMSTTLGGTGFVITKKIMKEIGWDMVSLVEDFEFSTKAVILGKKIGYAYDAVTYDEKPITLKASIKQRSRWMQGHWNVAIRMTLPLIWSIISNRKTNLLSAIDYIMYLWSPGRVIIYFFYLGFVLFLLAQSIIANNFAINFEFGLAFWFYLVILVVPRVVDYIYAVREGFTWWRLPLLIYFYTFYYFGWIPGSLNGFIDWRNQHIWDKTVHNVKTTVEKAGT